MISVSYISSVYSTEKTIAMLDNIKKVDLIHLDLMDGKYVEQKNFNIDELIDTFKKINKPLDVHLMVNNPEDYIEKLSSLNVWCITFHPETTTSPKKVIDKIKSYNIKAGLAINTTIEADSYEILYPYVDNILLMSVKAGYGGQTFLEKIVIDRLEYLKKIKPDYKFILSIDGGINEKVINKIKKYPIDIYVVGSYVCMNENFERPINKLFK